MNKFILSCVVFLAMSSVALARGGGHGGHGGGNHGGNYSGRTPYRGGYGNYPGGYYRPYSPVYPWWYWVPGYNSYYPPVNPPVAPHYPEPRLIYR